MDTVASEGANGPMTARATSPPSGFITLRTSNHSEISGVPRHRARQYFASGPLVVLSQWQSKELSSPSFGIRLSCEIPTTACGQAELTSTAQLLDSVPYLCGYGTVPRLNAY